MMGKLSKIAKSKMQTHTAGSEVDMGFLASLAARHVLDLFREAGLIGITTLVCRKVAEHCTRHAAGDWR